MKTYCNSLEEFKNNYPGIEPTHLGEKVKHGGFIYSYAGKQIKQTQGAERKAIKTRALILAIFTLGIAYLCSKEVRLNLEGKRIDQVFLKVEAETTAQKVDTLRTNINKVDKPQQPPFAHLATAFDELRVHVENKDVEKAKQILEKEPDLSKVINGIVKKNGEFHEVISYLLPQAVQLKDKAMITLLIEHGAQIDKPLRASPNVVDFAFKVVNDVEIVKLLLEKSGKTFSSYVELDLSTWIKIKRSDHYLELVEFLLTQDVNLNPDRESYSPLYQVASQWDKNPEQVKRLLVDMIKKGASLSKEEVVSNLSAAAQAFLQAQPQIVSAASSIPQVLEPYSLDRALVLINQARAEGKKIVLFAGREDNQSVPQEKDSYWCTLNVNMSKEGLDPSRPHLKIDFNNSEEMALLKHLFEKVVVDHSVIKFCEHSPWVRFMELLIPNKDSELIIESRKWARTRQLQNAKAILNPWEGTLDLKIEETIGKSKEQIAHDYLLPYHQKLEKGFKKLFDHVELKQNEIVLYRDEKEKVRDNYFCLKGPLWKAEDKLEPLTRRAIGALSDVIKG